MVVKTIEDLIEIREIEVNRQEKNKYLSILNSINGLKIATMR